MEFDKRNPGFPSDFLSPKEKSQKEYSLLWAKAIDAVGLTGAENGLYPGMGGENTSTTKYELWRAYARGNQAIDKYKPILGIKNRKRKDPSAESYRVLNFEILDIASKYVNVLIGKLIKQNNDIGINAIDKRAMDEKRKKRLTLQEYITNKNFLSGITKTTGIEFEGPEHNDVVPPPETHGEIDIYMQMFYKEDYCLIIQDLLKMMNEQDNYIDLLSECARDLVEVGVAVTKTYRVGNKILRRRCVPERMVMSSTQKSTCDDIKYIGEYWDLTIGQFKEIAGDQLSESDYRKISEQTTGSSYDNFNIPKYYSENLCYPWDRTKITVGDFTWFSPDLETYQVGMNRFGNVAVTKKEYDWWNSLRLKGVTEEKFNTTNQSKVINYTLDNQYGCIWVKNTDYVINYGKSKDILRNESSVGKTEGHFTIYKAKKCIMESIIPTLDNIQIQWMQYQHHAAKSVPAGQAIEFTALQDINIGGKGGKNLTPKEALQIYFETGILLWRRRDGTGNLSNFKPIEELAGGISNAMEKHFSFIIQDINLLRDQIGLNELTDASTPNSEMGKAVAEMASGATDDALRGLHFGFDWINLGTHKKTVMTISGMASTGLAPEYTEALGIDKMAIVALLSDVTYHELGVYAMKQATPQMKAWINEYCKAGITNGSLYEEEAFEIQTEPNIWRSVRLLKMYRKQKQDQKAAEMREQYKAEQDKNIQSAQATAEAQRGNIDHEFEKKKELIWEEAQAKLETDNNAASNQAFLIRVKAKLDKDEALTLEEENRLTELMKIKEQGRINVQIAQQKPKPTTPTKK